MGPGTLAEPRLAMTADHHVGFNKDGRIPSECNVIVHYIVLERYLMLVPSHHPPRGGVVKI